MKSRGKRLDRAWLVSPQSGIVELCRDWATRHAPPLRLEGAGQEFALLKKVPEFTFGCDSGYFVNNKKEIFFFLEPEKHGWIDWEATGVFLAGDVNGWHEAIGKPEWRLRRERLAGRDVFLLRDGARRHFSTPHLRFKFVTETHQWLDVPEDAPNLVIDDAGNRNRAVDPEKTGQHRFTFATEGPIDLSAPLEIVWRDPSHQERVPLRMGEFFFRMKTDLPLGAMVEDERTVFRLFAPRARRVSLAVQKERDGAAEGERFDLERGEDGCWETAVARNLDGWYYWYSVDGHSSAFGHFDPGARVLDPYALAAVGREGPGIIVDRRKLARAADGFRPPPWQDLVIAEAHVRDLTALAPIRAGPEERRGFAGLAKWIEHRDFYLSRLGVNAVELQPVCEFDNQAPEEYHWGYMTVNFFAPESSYGLKPEAASQIREFQEVVAAFHRRGMAVILDVVYNHVGLPAHLMFLDKLYYFELDSEGGLINWSGCGNDLRCRSAMAKRLIIDSLVHLIEVYGVDGFRFDLAELVGLEVLREIESALKRAKPEIILIAEPWSFRGHIAAALRSTGFASWNDGYRNFTRDYLRGGASPDALRHFLTGSPGCFASWPAQTVNYAESHDDRTWLDLITENPGHDGWNPTLNDVRRTHLMIALLMASIGIPMVAEGQDFLRSKRGVNNTYLRGDLNALDYKRIYRFPATHAYFADWIRFRLSPSGELLRLYSRPSEAYFRFFFAPESTAAACLYNADGSMGPRRLLFAINPQQDDAVVGLSEISGLPWRQLADHEAFVRSGSTEPVTAVEGELFLPGLSCGLWAAG